MLSVAAERDRGREIFPHTASLIAINTNLLLSAALWCKQTFNLSRFSLNLLDNTSMRLYRVNVINRCKFINPVSHEQLWIVNLFQFSTQQH